MRLSMKKILTVALFLAVGTGALFAGSDIKFQRFIPVSEVYGVNIDVNSEDIEIALWNRNEFRVTVISSTNSYPVFELSNGILSSEGTGSICKIEIKVPESFYAKSAYGGWYISTTSGSVYASKLWGDIIEIETTSGSIGLTKCEAQLAYISSSSGSINCSQCIFSNLLNAEATSGSIRFDGIAGGMNADTSSGSITASFDRPLTQDCNFDTASGAVNITLPENPGFKFVFDTASGSVYNAFTGYTGGRSGVDTYGYGYVVCRVDTASGSIRIMRK
ncbi:MAG: DUF4097 family beta strand repeat protein [Treponema sp.]|nr:DUF4097 family beta strand repeat protein [Candidatus Treponema caballi]